MTMNIDEYWWKMLSLIFWCYSFAIFIMRKSQDNDLQLWLLSKHINLNVYMYKQCMKCMIHYLEHSFTLLLHFFVAKKIQVMINWRSLKYLKIHSLILKIVSFIRKLHMNFSSWIERGDMYLNICMGTVIKPFVGHLSF